MAIVEEIIDEPQTAEQLKQDGNAKFANGDYEEAAKLYKQGITCCENDDEQKKLQSVLYSNLSAAYIKLEKWDDAVDSASKAIEIGAANEKPLERRAFAQSNISEKYEQAIEDYKQLQTMCESRKNEFESKIEKIQLKINERNEKLKDEVMQKLKGFGDFCLKPFGLSTDSFELKQNEQGGYSVQMKNQPTKEDNE